MAGGLAGLAQLTIHTYIIYITGWLGLARLPRARARANFGSSSLQPPAPILHSSTTKSTKTKQVWGPNTPPKHHSRPRTKLVILILSQVSPIVALGSSQNCPASLEPTTTFLYHGYILTTNRISFGSNPGLRQVNQGSKAPLRLCGCAWLVVLRSKALIGAPGRYGRVLCGVVGAEKRSSRGG